jgi:aspartyl-tRNA(Asn)/glutamyl-tRNA(Gln) amidotransferase subunit C
MPFTKQDVERLASLARLSLSADEIDLYARQLADILSYADQVLAVDTSGVPPTAQPLATPPPLRDDERRPSLSHDEALAAAPDPAVEAGFFRVPRVLG